MWGTRVVIPRVFHKPLLKELHGCHLGVSRMKSLARCYLWWPGIDTNIENVCRNCLECSATAKAPPVSPAHPWLIPQCPWQRIHVDHAQFGKHLLFIATDAYSKWPESFVVSSTSAQQTLDKLRIMFATHGLSNTLVSDNGPPFTSTEFNNFMKANGIVHRRVPPYHPSSNGLAENMVKTVKHALSKRKVSTNLTIKTHIARFLASYRNTRHTTTSRTPAELLLCRAPQTCLSLVHPCASQRIEETVEKQVGNHPPRHFTVNSTVLVQDFRDLRPTATDK